ncbi:MAG TPA: DNA-directed RNA polymerase subunit P [Candidatus Aenigmarchaeota archaeon]|nr:DNA-directed RNA polymerase subunit P [Candidatus Aenigmarchaeota archaeon]RLJ06076.1 MAG: DNA-directed RNA polymerase subunit P [Candidatus Aenigmarchaeota archaeon]HDI06551.1 DNA-directed RNA polymerase subunit P [Candidatus Aenigmarchaeota archaeon]
MTYTCVRCKGKIEKIEEGIICPHCGYRILMKDRAQKIKKIIAR